MAFQPVVRVIIQLNQSKRSKQIFKILNNTKLKTKLFCRLIVNNKLHNNVPSKEYYQSPGITLYGTVFSVPINLQFFDDSLWSSGSDGTEREFPRPQAYITLTVLLGIIIPGNLKRVRE